MPRNNLKLLIVGYSDSDADFLYSEFVGITNKLTYEKASNTSDIRAALFASKWDAIIANDSTPSFSLIKTIDFLKDCGQDIPLIVYAQDNNEKTAISAMRSGAHDYIQRGNTQRLLFSIERESKNAAVRHAKLQAESQIYRLEYYDELTGLPKRSLFCQKVSKILLGQTDTEAIAAIYFITFDRLPHINSTYGYNIGDILIQELSYRLSIHAGKNCLLTRIEGSKFAYFNNDITDAGDIQIFANRITKLVSTPFIINNLEFYVSLNIGICVYPNDGKDISMLLANAENTLPPTSSTNFWRNNCKYYLKELDEASSNRLKIERTLREAVTQKQLVLHFQPIVNLRTGEITGAEALVRWNHPDLGLLAPDQFIPLAHETGLIIDIGKWVLREACTQAKRWHNAGYSSMSIAVNISAIELDQSHLLGHVASVLEETGLFPNSIELEITESVLMEDAETSIKTLYELKELGVKIAVDDFGTGYSSLSYLKQFPIDILKIDRSFARDIATDPNSSAIITTIIALARSLGLTALAEGIETKEQFNFLYDGECDRGQGYLFSKPVNAQDLFYLLEQRKTGTLA